MATTVEIKGKKLIITADLQTPTPSASGKTMVIAGTHGNVATEAQYEGKVVSIGFTAYFKPNKV